MCHQFSRLQHLAKSEAAAEDVVLNMESHSSAEKERHPNLFSFSLSPSAVGYRMLQLRKKCDEGLWLPVSFSPVMIKVWIVCANDNPGHRVTLH
jgi:hypothetical protein